jgi:hypothetical protein
MFVQVLNPQALNDIGTLLGKRNALLTGEDAQRDLEAVIQVIASHGNVADFYNERIVPGDRRIQTGNDQKNRENQVSH